MTHEDTPKEYVTISVVVPVKNGGDDLQYLLSMIKNQKGFKDIEIITVDSGSTDRSLRISEEFGAKIIEIPPEKHSHSYARNLGAEHATGDYLLFTVQDALPPTTLWLHELFSVVKHNGVAAVSCADFPRETADLFYRVLSWNHYRRVVEIDKQDRIMCKPQDENHLTLRKNGNLSNVACLISRDVFMKYRFRGNYAEDLDLGIRLIRDGYKLAFLSSTRIIHSHNRPAYYYLKRGYVDNLSIPLMFPNPPVSAVQEAEHLLCHIVSVYEALNSVVYEALEQVTVPCTVRRLSNIAMEKFRVAEKGHCSVTINFANHGYIDSKFRFFLEDIYNRYYSNGENNSRYDGILFDEMRDFTKVILEYMTNTYDLIDYTVLEEFKSCLYKGLAWLCGLHLGSCFLRGSENAKEEMKEINEELVKEV